jgi:elongation factor G
MAAWSPVLLEPIYKLEIYTTSDATARVTALVPQHRGQILGFDAREGWDGWDVVEALMPLAEMSNLIIELRSATAGVASYRASFDHMAELTGRSADMVLDAQGKAA